MNTQRFDWTEAQIVVLSQLHSMGLSASQIGEKMGLSRNAIIGKLNRHKDMFGAKPAPTPKKPKAAKKSSDAPWTQERVAEAARLWARGDTASAIAEAIGKKTQQFLNYVHLHRDTFPTRGRGRQRAKAHRETASSPEYIAAEFLVPPEGYDADRLEHAKVLHELAPSECHWPLNNGGPFLFCAAGTETGATYCVHHHLRTLPEAGTTRYVSPKPKRNQQELAI